MTEVIPHMCSFADQVTSDWHGVVVGGVEQGQQVVKRNLDTQQLYEMQTNILNELQCSMLIYCKQMVAGTTTTTPRQNCLQTAVDLHDVRLVEWQHEKHVDN